MSHPKQGGVALTDTKAERRTASECVRTYRPKGVAVASERAREAHRMYREEHVPIDEIAAHLGVSPAMVHQYVRRVEEQIADERNLRRTR